MNETALAGLSSADAAARLEQHGANRLPEPVPPGPLALFLSQFRSPFIYVLLAAAIVSFALGQTVNAWFILAVLLINATIGTIQEYSAERAAAALRNLVPSYATVIRDGKPGRLDTTSVVPDDVLQLVSGDRVPADCALCTTHDLEVDESMLTGESLPVAKRAADGEASDPAARCFAGTLVKRGRGLAVVTATGQHTEIGHISHLVVDQTNVRPPLSERIERFTVLVSWAMVVLISVILAITLLRGDDLSTVFLIGVALAVSAIPEGLPAAITVALAIGMRRMAKVNVIIRRLLAVEALGSCTFIASDKTGTLTVNEMTVKRVCLPDGTDLAVSGEGIDPHGTIEGAERHAKALRALVESGALSNEGRLEARDGAWVGTGDTVDVAFLALAHKLGVDPERLRKASPAVAEIPYESEIAYAASLNRHDGHHVLHVKGALERLLPMCASATDGVPLDTAALYRRVSALAADGYRVLAVARRPLDAAPDDLTGALHDLELIGFVGIIDPVRPEAVFALEKAREASVETAMVTGDHPQTALAIARELGLVQGAGSVVTGEDLEQARAASEDELDALVRTHRVFARISPAQKSLVVDRLIAAGHFVAVTGDGVNDAPALRRAHVGVAMGERGTDVARESADLILTDDNFASIVNGVREGRVVYANIRKVIFLLISTGAAEITLFLWSLTFGLPLPLFPVQLLWLNLVTNGVQDVALAFEPAEGDELEHPPRRPDEPIFDPVMIERVLLNAAFMGSVAFAVFFWVLNGGASETEARNTTLLLMVLFENVHALNSRSEHASLFSMNFFGNPLLLAGIVIAQAIHIGSMYLPWISGILEISPVSPGTWLQLLGIALLLLVFDEGHKLLMRRRRAAPVPAPQDATR